MQSGLSRLLGNAPPILVTLALVVFLGNILADRVTGAFSGFAASHPLLRMAEGIIAGGFAPALLIGLAASIHYLRQPPKG